MGHQYSFKSAICRSKTLFLLIITMLLASFGNSTGQTTSNYVFSANSGTYNSITGNSFAPLGNGDEGAYNGIPIGFTFRYWNTNYTTVSASTNGWMTFGQNISGDPYYGYENNLASGSYIPLVAPLWDDMEINSGSYEDFSYNTTGSQPNRIFTAQWTGMKWKFDARGDVISFQVKLYEANGKIEFIYNQGSAEVNDGSASIGIAGPGASGNSFISLSETGTNPAASSVTETSDLNTRPANGQIYSFVPGTMSVSSPAQVPSGNIFKNSVNNLLSAFQVTANDANAVLSSISFTTSGTSTSGDISNLKLFYNNTSTFPGSSPLQIISPYSGSNSYSFSDLSQQVFGGSTGYFWITCDIKSTATVDRTIKVAVNPVLSFQAGSPSGTIAEGGNQTIKGASVTISSPVPAAGNISQGSINNVIYRFDNSVVNESTSISALTIITSGDYSATDISNIKIWYSSDAAFDPADILFGTLTSALGPGAHYFTKLSRAIPVNSTGYIFVTVDASCSASASKTFSVNAVTTSDISFSSGTVKSGSTNPGGIQTIQNAVLSNAASPSATPNTITADLSWTNPAGCRDEIMIVARATSSVSGTPTGDGSSYSANLSYGLGTGFGGGFVVYKGLASPQTVTGLTASTEYNFKFYTRNGNQWSSGIEIKTTTGAPSASDYQSAATGDWQTLATWQIFKGGSWQTPDANDGTPTKASGNITLQNPHNITNTSTGLDVDQMTIEAGSNLINNGTINISGVVNGTITNSGAVTSSGTMSFNSGSSYIHNRDGGSIPTATWNSASTCNITGVTVTAPSGLDQAFGNFTWNCTSQTADLDLGGNPASITGTFTMTSTGSNSISPGGSVIYGNYSQTGGTYSLLGGNTVARTISVVNFSMEGGQIKLSDAAGTAGTLNVSGNFSHSAGTISETSTGNGNIVFKGSYNGTSGMQTFTSGGTVSGAINFTVNSGAYLQMAEAGTIVSGDGTFTLSSGGTLGITSALGISLTGAAGNIQTTGNRSFSTAANYIYNNNGAQLAGSGLPITAISGGITVAGTSSLTLTNSIISNSYLTVNGILIPGASHIISGTGNITGFGTVKVTRTAATADFLSQYSIAGKNLTNLKVDYAVLTGGQVISPVSYSNLQLSNSGGTNTISGNVNVASTLTTTGGGTLAIGATGFLTASNFTNHGTIIFNPNAKGTITNIINNGTINLESDDIAISSLITDNFSGNNPNIGFYVPALYHYISSPFSNMTASTITGEPNNSAIMEYRENLVTNNMNNGWVTTTGNHYDPVSGNWPGGFGSWNDMLAGHGYNYYSDASYTYTLSGPINTSSKSVNLVYNSGQSAPAYPTQQGYNLLGNPFTSSMNWDIVVNNNSSLFGSSVEQAIYFRLNGITVVYNNGVTNPNTYNTNGNLIPPLQGFFVKANSNAAGLILSSGARVHSASKRYKGLEETIPLIRLDLTGSGKSDQAVVRFDTKATTEFDSEFDAYKFMPSTDDPTISSSLNGIEYSINGIPFPSTPASIPLILNAPVSGSYTINANELTGMDGYHVYLSDNLLGTNVDLRESPSYIFSSVSGKIQDRFVLSISNLMTAIPENRISKHPFNIFSRDNMINILTMGDDWNGKKGNIRILDMNGRVMTTKGDVYFEKGGLTQIPFNAEKGIYFVEIKSGIQRSTGKVLVN